jgi:hypothetical protein
MADSNTCEAEDKDLICSGNYKCLIFSSGTFLSPLGETALIVPLLLGDVEKQMMCEIFSTGSSSTVNINHQIDL